MPTVSMRDVATHAGVSTATVSHVINNTRYVAEETRQRVLDAVKALNYNPNAMARILRTGRKGIIGFLIPDISNPFYSELIEEVETVFFEQGYRLLLSNSHEDSDRELENMRVMSSGIVDGVLVASSLKDCNELNGIVPEGLPMVFLDQVVPNCSCDIVRVNTYDAVAEATEELIRNGHTGSAAGFFSFSGAGPVQRHYRAGYHQRPHGERVGRISLQARDGPRQGHRSGRFSG